MRVMHFSPVWRVHRSEPVQRRRLNRLACLAGLVAALLMCVLPQAASAESGVAAALGAELGASSLEPSSSTGPEEISLTPSTTEPYYACPSEGCQAIDEPPAIKTTTGYELPDGTQLVGGGPEGGYTPEELELAYKIPTTGGKEPEQQTVALIDAHGDTTAESDLAVYREHYKLGECKKENTKKEVTNCFRKVNQEGKEEKYPANEAGWGTETSLDLDMVSAACPECHILLVEANNEEESEMAASVNKAVELGATEISSSYGFPETYATRCPETGCSKYQSDYNHSGIPIMVSAGDFGYDNRYYPVELSKPAPMFPASSPTVIAVGGTALHIEKSVRSSETVWSESGGGCSAFESTKGTGQKETEEKESRKGCTSDRTDNDVASDASCATPVSFYSTPGFGGWSYECGTSVASPFVAGIEAHVSKATRALGANAFYKKPSMLFHVSEGSNGECGTESEATWYLCHATKEGYNGPTGMGTPAGVFTSTAAPSVTTRSATSVTETGATLNGTVNPNGLETKYYFEYGTTESYGSKTAEASAGSGESSVEESKAVTGLTLGTTYDFRITATNSEGTTHGANQKVTPSGKPTVETKAATSLSETGATLNGSVNPKGAETKYYFEYGTTESYGTKTAEASAGSGITPLEESKAITGLTPGTTYHFRIVATNSKGTTDGEGKTFTLSGKPSVETKAATSVSETGATLNGTVNPKGAETKYYFEYGTTESYGTKTAEASAGSGITPLEESKAITGLTKSTTYYFRIVATNSHGTSDGLNQVFATNPLSWSVVSTLNVSGATYNALYGDSCTSPSACTAVGTSFKGSEPNAPLAERWNGKEWTIQEIPYPTEATDAALADASCTSSEACMAVGEDGTKAGEGYLAESWNGKEWSPTESKTSGGILRGVSCTSATACIAVGENGTSVFAEGWNGKEWSTQEAPTPTGATSIFVYGVSCSSSNECTLVGSYKNSSGTRVTLAERWNGKEWAIQEIPTPSEGKASYLTGVSCTSATTCMASGYHQTSEGGWVPFAESWNGKEWVIQTMPTPEKAENTYIEGVSCASAMACTAVGESKHEVLLESWNGKEWSVQTAPKLSGSPESTMFGVSCTSATTCDAVGRQGSSLETRVTLAERYE